MKTVHAKRADSVWQSGSSADDRNTALRPLDIYVQVSVELVGSRGSSGRLQLLPALQATRPLAGRQMFQQGQADGFLMALPDVGDLQQLVVWHDCSGASAAWHLDYAVACWPHPHGRLVYFVCCGGLGADQPGGAKRTLQVSGRNARPAPGPVCMHGLEPGGGAPTALHCFTYSQAARTVVARFGPQATPLAPRSPPPPSPQASSVDPSCQFSRFLVRVHTSMLPEAGTSARVHLALHGSQGTSKRLLLRGSFQQGCVDECELPCRDVGSVRSICIGHDGSGGLQQRQPRQQPQQGPTASSYMTRHSAAVPPSGCCAGCRGQCAK
jgi:hypothetical protein